LIQFTRGGKQNESPVVKFNLVCTVLGGSCMSHAAGTCQVQLYFLKMRI